MDLLIAMFLFSLSMSISPGPVNLICLTSGVNHGFRKTLPFVSGATIGFTLLLILIGTGIGFITNKYINIFNILTYLGSAFIAYVGCKIIASSNTTYSASQNTKAPSFTHGFMIQWLNPKAWLACIAGTTAFGISTSTEKLVLFASIYFIVCYIGISAWALAGNKLSNLLDDSKYMSVFNTAMGILLIGIAIYLLLS